MIITQLDYAALHYTFSLSHYIYLHLRFYHFNIAGLTLAV